MKQSLCRWTSLILVATPLLLLGSVTQGAQLAGKISPERLEGAMKEVLKELQLPADIIGNSRILEKEQMLDRAFQGKGSHEKIRFARNLVDAYLGLSEIIAEESQEGTALRALTEEIGKKRTSENMSLYYQLLKEVQETLKKQGIDLKIADGLSFRKSDALAKAIASALDDMAYEKVFILSFEPAASKPPRHLVKKFLKTLLLLAPPLDLGPSDLQVASDSAIKLVDDFSASKANPSLPEYCALFASITKSSPLLQKLFQKVACTADADADAFSEQLMVASAPFRNRARRSDAVGKQLSKETESLGNLVHELIELRKKVQ